jgi:hypothetical protein
MLIYDDEYLQQNYNLLQKERSKMKNLENEFQTLNSAANDSILVVSSNYYNYIILLLLCILLFFLLIRYIKKTNQYGGSNNLRDDAFFILTFILLSLSFIHLLNYLFGHRN